MVTAVHRLPYHPMEDPFCRRLWRLSFFFYTFQAEFAGGVLVCCNGAVAITRVRFCLQIKSNFARKTLNTERVHKQRLTN